MRDMDETIDVSGSRVLPKFLRLPLVPDAIRDYP